VTVYDDKPIATASTMPSPPEAKKGARVLVIVSGVLVAIALAPFAVGLASALVMYELFARPYAWLARRMQRLLVRWHGSVSIYRSVCPWWPRLLLIFAPSTRMLRPPG
jgi:hypothetical protein